jgi:hypothetical protein
MKLIEKRGHSEGKFLLILFGILFIFSLEFLSSAITIVSPANSTNFTGAFGPLVIFNVTYLNGTDFTDAKNVTFYYNLSGVWTKIASSVPALGCSNAIAGALSSCNASLNLSGLADGRYLINATLANTTTASSGGSLYLLYGASTITYNITLDSTPPNVSTFYTSANNGNYSGTITLNVSVSDGRMGIDSVYFNITNSSGIQINFTKATASGIYYNISIDTSKFTDGKYNVTIYANDTQLNNLNNTEKIQITLDNTVPTAAFSCTPTQVYSGDTVTCSCVPADPISGVNSSATSYTTSPSTSDSGTHTISCSFADMAGKVGTATADFNVRLYSSTTTSGGGSSTSTYSKTIPTTGDLSETQTIQTSSFSGGGLAVKERVTFKLNSEEHYLGVRELTSSSVKIEIASEPVQIVLNIGEEIKKDLNNDGYYDVSVVLNGITNSKADLTMNYLHELITSSEKITTDLEEESIPSENIALTGEFPWVWIAIGVIVLVIIIGGGFAFKKKKK